MNTEDLKQKKNTFDLCFRKKTRGFNAENLQTTEIRISRSENLHSSNLRPAKTL